MLFRILIVFCVFSGSCFAYENPELIIKQYCKMDSLGYALSSDLFEKNIVNLVTEESAESAPGWDVVSVIKEYKIGKATIKNGKAIVPVRYYILGILNGDHFEYNEKFKTFDYNLVIVEKKWKISKFKEPKISIDTAINVLKNLLKDFSEDSDKDRINAVKNSINNLNKLKMKYGK